MTICGILQECACRDLYVVGRPMDVTRSEFAEDQREHRGRIETRDLRCHCRRRAEVTEHNYWLGDAAGARFSAHGSHEY